MKVIFIGGFLHPTNWIPFNSNDKPEYIDIITLYPSPIGSLHDRLFILKLDKNFLNFFTTIHNRACQIFYELVGGRVDYGESHSKYHNHSRFGRIYKYGKHPKWSDENPIYFIGIIYKILNNLI